MSPRKAIKKIIKPAVAKTEKEKARASKRAPRIPQTLRGMKDILPSEEDYWEFIQGRVFGLAKDFDYGRIETPILEETNLFVRSVGRDTDIVEKEMYTFDDQSGENVALRPEGTAGVARAYINHGMLNLSQPVKLWYMGPMFRYDRPQSGRLRQFHQFGFEALGEQGPIMDAQLIAIAHDFFKEIGLPVTVQINSLGTPESRQAFKTELVSYYRGRRGQICEDCKKRLNKNPLRLLDCKEPQCREVRAEAPQIVDWLDEESKNHFMKVLEYLDEIEVPYVLNSFLVRGLDYYTRTVFEIWPEGDEEEARQNSLGGGGRYDLLIELLGGRPTPACGFAIGIERVICNLKAREISPPVGPAPKIFLAQLGEASRAKALSLFEEFRKAKIPVAEAFSRDSLKGQLEVANRLGVKYSLILGQKEVLDGTILIRDMEAGIQEIVDLRKVIKEVQKKIAQEEGNNLEKK